jgi:hypothetical protein
MKERSLGVAELRSRCGTGPWDIEAERKGHGGDGWNVALRAVLGVRVVRMEPSAEADAGEAGMGLSLAGGYRISGC